MTDEYFGHKELYAVTLRAKTPMQFGDRYIEAEEPVLYFDNVNMSVLNEQNHPIFARGGWANMPRVIWDERTEVTFQMVEGVMSKVGMSILLSANVTTTKEDEPILVNIKEGPLTPNENGEIYLSHSPVNPTVKKTFIFDYDRNTIQQKVYASRGPDKVDAFGTTHYCIKLFEDKNLTRSVNNNREFMVDYYYEYRDEVKPLIYTVQKERFNGLFTLEAKFYSKDENEGKDVTNMLYMPKVRIVSSINLRLGERADPTASTFNIVGLPETDGEYKNLIMKITHLGQDIDADI